MSKKLVAFTISKLDQAEDIILESKIHKIKPILHFKYYILNGEKQFISNGSWANIFTILAQVNGDKFSGFIIDRDTEGFDVGTEETKMGMKGSSTTPLKLSLIHI